MKPSDVCVRDLNATPVETLRSLDGPKTIALIADKRRWAFDAIGSHLKALLERDFDVSVAIVYAEDYPHFEDLTEHLIAGKHDVIHWFWRKHLWDVVDFHVSLDQASQLQHLLADSGLSFSIPEGLYATSEDLFQINHIFHLADGYCTVSDRLRAFYSDQALLPPPDCVLYDRTDLIVGLTERERRGSGDAALHVVWAGNSDWGRWLGLHDAKGLQLIRAAVAKARERNSAIDFTAFDSAEKQAEQREIGNALLGADVYICGSGDQEGTPLPVLEAMAAGCAVITADVGVAREVLPEAQQDLIVNRTIDAFAIALSRCASDKAWTRRLGEENRAAMRAWVSRRIQDDWMRFFTKIHRRAQSAERVREKTDILHNLYPSPLNVKLEKLRRFTRRSPVLSALAKPVWPHLAPLADRLITQGPENRIRRLKNYNNTLSAHKGRKIPALAVYTPMWAGVAASTRSLFTQSVPIPFSSNQHPSTVTSKELDEYVRMLTILSPSRLVLSGAETLHWNLLQRLRAARPNMRVEIMSHSSQLQWTQEHFRDEFLQWLPAYHSGQIAKIWVLKQGLDVVLRNIGIESECIENHVLQQAMTARQPPRGTPVKVGIWSIDNDWRKNLLSQFLAFAGKKEFLVHYTATDPVLNDLLRQFGVPHIQVNKGPLPRSQLLNWMGKMDLNLYITLSECSPMVPLESMSLGVPVLVGPTTTYFDRDPVLKNLVVPSPENMQSIQASTEYVLRHYLEISQRIVECGLDRDAAFVTLKNRLNAADGAALSAAS